MARYGLDLQQKNKSKKKRTVSFICVFMCFVILLGSVSVLLLWRSLNYDFNNIFVAGDVSTTKEPETTKPEEKVYAGEYLFLVAVTSDDGKETRFLNLISVDLSEKVIRVVPVDSNIADSKTGFTCAKLLETNGIKSVVSFLNNYYGREINRYVLLTETGYKSFFRAMGDITVKVSEDIAYDTADMFLELKRGENVLTPDKTYKYMKYLCETKKGYECSKANAEIIVAAFNAFCTVERFSSADNTFSIIIDYCTTDITIVDFTNAKDELEYLLPKTSKEKLKVFVSDNIMSTQIIEESSDE